MRRHEIERIRNLSYGDAGKRNLLDIYRPRSGGQGCPTLLQIHGGGWVIGQKDQQGLPLMHHMASRGWVCVAPNYRLSPKAMFPDHFIETNRALAFDRHAAYGMRLDIPAGTAVRFEPGETKTVTLVAIAGARVIRGGNNWAGGPVTEGRSLEDVP
jgi:hypothetical protein